MPQKPKATAAPKPTLLKDYRPPSHLIDTVDLHVALDATRTRVQCRLAVRANPDPAAPKGALVLNGSHFELESVALNGRVLARHAYETNAETLTLHNPPAGAFTIETTTHVNPEANKALQGLYRSGGVYCTQCEAEGFRRITCMLDRPDVLARYRVRLEACVNEAPILLANGNLIERGTLAGGRHYAVWEDPHPKPCYLFALVAGDLGSIASQFVTMSGRRVALTIYVEHGKEARAAWAMDALKRSMAWDERRFGREYDLDCFNIVAVSDFNLGAMENKGLNIFNDRLILASAETATDANYEAIESVVAHEYFHNWTGNRITCRDWFQLCLKEGLTVYRDQEFSADERSPAVQRITDVRILKAAQFPEDAGPLAHPVRPDTYIEINNFYTATVYEKGAEVVRMLACVLGGANFRAGLDLYFARHDGQAATVEEFIACFEDAAGRDLSSFMEWYRQSGTPHVKAQTAYDPKARTLTLTLEQAPSTKAKSGRSQKPAPLRPIPLRLGLVAPNGRDEPLKLANGELIDGGLVVLTKPKETLTFSGLSGRPAVSLLRGFSAPVLLSGDQRDRELAFLAAHDSDAYNRWQSARELTERALLAIYCNLAAGKRPSQSVIQSKALAAALATPDLDPAFGAELLRLPSIADLMAAVSGGNARHAVDPEIAIRAHQLLSARLGRVLADQLETMIDRFKVRAPYSPDAVSAGRRAVCNACLTLLAACGTAAAQARTARHYDEAANMTDAAHALSLLVHMETPARVAALRHFERRWQNDDLVIDTWFVVQAQSRRAGAFEDIVALTRHPRFKLTAPNKVRALIGTFAHQNPRHFHRADGQGYAFVARHVIAIDRFNPQVAARLATSFRTWRTLTPRLSATARTHLKQIASAPDLSRDVQDVTGRMLG